MVKAGGGAGVRWGEGAGVGGHRCCGRLGEEKAVVGGGVLGVVEG